jgi:hypothetical protein
MMTGNFTSIAMVAGSLLTTLFSMVSLLEARARPSAVDAEVLASVFGGDFGSKAGTDKLIDNTPNSCFTGCYSAGGHGFKCMDVYGRREDARNEWLKYLRSNGQCKLYTALSLVM